MHIRTRHAVRREHSEIARVRNDKLDALARASAPDARKRRACAEYIAAAMRDDADTGDDDDDDRDFTTPLRCCVCRATADATRVMRKSFEISNPWARCDSCDRSAHARCFVAAGAGSTRVLATALTCARCVRGVHRDSHAGGGGDDDVRPKRLRFDDDGD